MRIAYTRAVSPAIARCELTHLDREPIDVARATAQHAAYEALLTRLGVEVRRLPEAPAHPDGVFVEDTAIVLDELAIVTRPGAPSRRGETPSVAAALARHRVLHHVTAPATLDGGDVLVTSRRRVYVGQSSRTDAGAVEQLAGVLAPFGYDVVPVPLHGCLHLKSAVTEVARGLLLLNPAWVDPGVFRPLDWIAVDPGEPHAANALALGQDVIHPAACPRTQARLAAEGLRVHPVEVGELAKAEAGVTCCSLLLASD